jgi:hypothetical protein
VITGAQLSDELNDLNQEIFNPRYFQEINCLGGGYEKPGDCRPPADSHRYTTRKSQDEQLSEEGEEAM